MCGITGILRLGGDLAVDERIVTAMRDTLTHRGPDDQGTWCDLDAGVALAHRRLSIVDLSPSGRNPMSEEDGRYWIVYNGEIYNHAALRAGLEARGHVYRSNTDTETILHLYEEEGPRCVERLQGMFALAIWDRRERTLFLARDRLGIKPLYLARAGGGLLFGSEIKALLAHPALGRELDEDAFRDYLTFVATPAPRTMFRGIEKLAPAERVLVRADGRMDRERWWHPAAGGAALRDELATLSDDAAAERLLALVRAAVGKRMMADVPFGVFLSGGIDSSTNVALMSELMDEPVRTFSVGFGGHALDELEHARRTAHHFGTDHHEVDLAAGDLEAFLPEMVVHQDEPIADWVCVPLYYVSKLAKSTGTTVVQVGEGADELLHGYKHYHAAARLHRRLWGPMQRMPAPLRGAVAASAIRAAAISGRGRNTAHFLEQAAAGHVAFWGGAIAFAGSLKREVLAGAPPDRSYDVVQRLWDEASDGLGDAGLLQRMTYLELRQRLAELLLMRVDKMTMATSVAARVPFLDHELVEFAYALPDRMKVRDGVGKWLLRHAVRDLLPPETIARPKMGFSAPVADWFRGDLGRRAQSEIRASSLRDRGLLDYGRIDRLWDEHRTGRSDWSFQLWNIYNVSLWHDEWIGRP